MSYVDVFGGENIDPSQLSFTAITVNNTTVTLVWPFEVPGDSTLAADKIEATTTATAILKLPDCTLVSTGKDIFVKNLGSASLSIVDNAGGAVGTVANGEVWIYYVRTNATAAGSWGSLQMGAATSSANAATLDGLGVVALATTLNQDHPVTTKNASYQLVANDRAGLFVNTGGSISFTFLAAATLAAGWFAEARNDGSGTLTLNPDGAELIDGAATKVLQIGESCQVHCDGSAFYTVGYGRSATVTTTAANISIAGGAGTQTLSASEVANTIQNLTGAITGNRAIEYGTSAGFWFVFNNTTGSFSVTLKVNAADTGVAITQGNYLIIRSDGTNITGGVTAASGTVTSVATGTGLSGGPITSSGTITLANTAVVAGAYGASGANIPTFTVDAQGRLTASADRALTAANVGAVASTLTISTTAPLAGGGDLSTNRTLTLNDTAVTPASYGSATASPTYTVDAKGRLTAAANVTITPAFSSLTGTPTTLAGYGITNALALAGGTMTGPILLAAGTTSNVSLARSNNVDTGVDYSVDNEVSLTVNTTQRVTAHATGMDVTGVIVSDDGIFTLNGESYGWGDGTTQINGSSASDTISISCNSVTQIVIGDANVLFPAISTTVEAANAYLNPGVSNALARSTSSLRFKMDVEPLDSAHAIAILRGLSPMTFRSAIPTDDPSKRHFGLGAEDVAIVEPSLVHFGYRDEDMEVIETPSRPVRVKGPDGRMHVVQPPPRRASRPKSGVSLVPDGVQYERLTVIQTAVLVDVLARLEALEAK